MKLLEASAAIKRATKEDLFTGAIYDLKEKQSIKENTTFFYRDIKTGQFQGPHILFSNNYFPEIYAQMTHGMIGVIVPMPNVVTNEILFDLVLREASIDDMKDAPRHIKLNRIYYTYDSQILIGPLYTDNSTTSLYIENLLTQKKLFVPNERQHYRKKTFKNTSLT
jgi:hypothetical protein